MHKVNGGFCAEIFDAGDGKLLKLGNSDWDRAQMLQEYETTKTVGELGIAAPAVYGFVEAEGRYGFLMEKLEDRTMLHRIDKSLGRAFALAKQLARLHFDIHKAPMCELPGQEDVFVRAIGTRKTLTKSEQTDLIRVVRALPKGKMAICHGDFHPLNILYQGNRPAIIDWGFAYTGDPRGDVAGTYMITKLMATKVAAKTRVEHFMFRVFTPVFAELYLKEYRRLSGYSRREILAWLPVRAATYLDHDLPERQNDKLHRLARKYCGGAKIPIR